MKCIILSKKQQIKELFRFSFLQTSFTLELYDMIKNEIKLKQKRIDVLGTYKNKITNVKFD